MTSGVFVSGHLGAQKMSRMCIHSGAGTKKIDTPYPFGTAGRGVFNSGIILPYRLE
jgi:hypothetical protein